MPTSCSRGRCMQLQNFVVPIPKNAHPRDFQGLVAEGIGHACTGVLDGHWDPVIRGVESVPRLVRPVQSAQPWPADSPQGLALPMDSPS